MKHKQARSSDSFIEDVIIYTDGAKQNNSAAIGYLFYSPIGDELHRKSQRIGKHSSVSAEFNAIKTALKEAKEQNYTSPIIRIDYQGIITAIETNTAPSGLENELEELQQLLDNFEEWRIEHIGREENKVADGLACGVLS